MGVSYYTNELSFPFAGKNKHVVRMAGNWPNGLYHAVLTYPDGSTKTKSIVIDIE
jgi:hypothetical protein